MNEDRIWYAYEEGSTLNKRGPVGGKILRDEEYGDIEESEDADARITLEQQSGGTFAVTANLYGGWLQETATFAASAEAETAYESARKELARLADLLPDEEDSDMTAAMRTLNEHLSAFTSKFGGKPTI